MKLPIVKPKELVRVLDSMGCIEKRHTGSHKIFYYPRLQKIISVPIHTKDIKKGLLRAIIKELELSLEEFIVLYQ